MRSTLQKFFATYDYLTSRYKASIATDTKDIQACIAIRKKVFSDELRRLDSSRNINIGEKDSWDDIAIHIACTDTKSNEIIGSMRMIIADELVNDVDCFAEYHLNMFDSSYYPKIYVVNRLAVLKDHRSSAAGILLAQKGYKIGLENTVMASVCVCEPSLFPLYRRLGYLPLDKISPSPLGGYRLPLFIIPHHYQHLKKVRSPFIRTAKTLNYPTYDQGIQWLVKNNQLNHNLPIGFAPFNVESNDFTLVLTNGISEAGKKSLFAHAININCIRGDTVVKEGSGDNGFGFIKSGALEVVKQNKVISILGCGDIFGETALLLNQPRTASLVVATNDTQIVLLSRSGIKKMSNEADQVCFWRNLATILASRLCNS